MVRNFSIVLSWVLQALFCISFFTDCASAQGIFVSGVGARNRSMGSAAVAAPLDSAGAINYNPATLGALTRSEVQIGLELLSADTSVSSSISPLNLSGSTNSDENISPIPTFSLVSREKDSDYAFGLGFLGVAGFRTDYPASTSNPVLLPQSMGGLGRVMGAADYFQASAALSYRVCNRTFLGISPILTIGRLEATPLVFAAPNSDGSYPSGSTPNYTYGGGFQLGVYHETEEGLNLGASFKSTQWMESDTINTTDQNGLPRRESLGVDLPMVLSVGTSYTGLSQWLFALDVRYFDYAHTQGFEHRGYEATGAVKGLGWDSIWSVSPAIQYKPTEKLALRIGYTYNQNPIGSQESIFNVASPLIVEQVLGLGASYAVAENTLLSLTYLKGFENSSSGAFETPNGIVPGTSVTNSTSADAVAMAVTLYY